MLKKKLFSLFLCTIALSAMAQNTYKSHTVQRGETYESIAQLYGVSVDAIKRANPNNYNLIYAGMKLVIPESAGNVVTTSEPASQPKSTTKADKKKQKEVSTSNAYKQEPTTTTHTSSTSDRSESSSKSQERNQSRVLGGLTYYATDFKGFKGSSHYGITMDVLNIEGSLFGFNTTLAGLNYGFVDKDYASYQCWFGPNISYEVVPNISVALPVQANVDVVFDVPTDIKDPNSEKKNKVTWGWAVSPRVYCHINRLSINVGIMVSGGFKSSNVSCGMTAGIGYQF